MLSVEQKRLRREAAHFVLSGAAMVFATIVATVWVARSSYWLAAFVFGAICWREYVFAGLRVELDRLRKD